MLTYQGFFIARLFRNGGFNSEVQRVESALGSYSLNVEPAVNPAGVGIPVPHSGLVNTAPLPGDNWSLDTTGIKPCGYVLHVVATDRAIINSQSVGHHVPTSVGFCLEEPVRDD